MAGNDNILRGIPLPVVFGFLGFIALVFAALAGNWWYTTRKRRLRVFPLESTVVDQGNGLDDSELDDYGVVPADSCGIGTVSLQSLPPRRTIDLPEITHTAAPSVLEQSSAEPMPDQVTETPTRTKTKKKKSKKAKREPLKDDAATTSQPPNSTAPAREKKVRSKKKKDRAKDSDVGEAHATTSAT